MKPNYKNWMPAGMVAGFCAAFGVAAVLLVISIALSFGTVVTVIIAVLTAFLALVSIWTILLYRAFDYNGKRQMSRQIISGIADFVDLPDGAKCLDVGCGSGALTIACAKRNPAATVVGLDRWGAEYASFSKKLCEQNADAEGVNNVSFRQGNAVKLDLADASFDCVTSNYVYHNIPSSDRQALLLETLRVLKKGGTFAIHDIMSRQRYGDMQAFAANLRAAGYERVELIDTANGMFMSRKEAALMGLTGSTLLTGKK